MRRLAVIGAGLAGHRVATALREEGFNGELLVIGDEVHMPYDRPPLSKQLLGGSFSPADCAFAVGGLEVTWVLGSAAARLDVEGRTVTLASGREITFDGVALTTGRRARPWVGPVPEGVVTLRSLDDALALRAAATPSCRIVIVGAGFIGCEVAATLSRSGDRTVTVVDIADQPMPVLGVEAGARAATLHRTHGVDLRLGIGVERLEGDPRIETVVLTDGSRLPADLVLVAMGSLPNTDWLTTSGLRLTAGAVACTDGCVALDQAGRPVEAVVVAGDIAAWEHPHAAGLSVSIEHWTNARDMAAVAAASLVRPATDRTPLLSVPTFWSDQYHVKIKSAGYLRAANRLTVVDEDQKRGMLVVEAHRDEKLVGAIVFNANRAIISYQRTLMTTAVP